MPLAQNGRGIRGLVWTDSDGQPHTILLAYLGDKVVWDGHIHETMQAPTAIGQSAFQVPVVSADALVAAPSTGALADFPAPELVSGGVTIRPEPLDAVDAKAFVPVLHSDHTLDVEVATAAGDLLAPDIRVVFGVTPESMNAASVLHSPTMFASAVVAPPAMEAFVEVRNPDVGSWAIIEPPVLTADTAGSTPGVVANSRVDGEVAAGSAAPSVPALTAGSTVAAVDSSAAAAMQVPDILSSGPAFVSATPGTSSASVTVPAGGSLVVAAYNNAAGDPTVTCSGGVTLTKAASSSQVTLFYAVGVAAGTYTITNTSGGSFKSFVAGVYSGVTAVSAGTLASGSSTTPSVTPAGSGLLAVSAFRGGSIPAGTTSTGDIRGRQATTSNDLVLVDRVSAPVSLSLASSTAWAACAVWLT